MGHPTNSTYTSTHAVGRKRRPEATEEVSQDGPVTGVSTGGPVTGVSTGAPTMDVPATGGPATARSSAESTSETRQQSARISNRIRTLRGRCQSFFSMNAQHPTDSNNPSVWHRPYRSGRPTGKVHTRTSHRSLLLCNHAGSHRPEVRTRAPHKRIEQTMSTRTDLQQSTRSNACVGNRDGRATANRRQRNATSITKPAAEGRAAERDCPRRHTSGSTKHDSQTHPIAGVYDERKGLIKE